MADEGSSKYWYNPKTGEVEFGLVSPSSDRIGPFDTAEAAALAPERLRENSRAWAAEEAAEDTWGARTDVDSEA